MKDKFDELTFLIKGGAIKIQEAADNYFNDKPHSAKIAALIFSVIKFIEGCLIEGLENKILESPERSDLKEKLIAIDRGKQYLEGIFENQLLTAYTEFLEEEIEQLTNPKPEENQ